MTSKVGVRVPQLPGEVPKDYAVGPEASSRLHVLMACSKKAYASAACPDIAITVAGTWEWDDLGADVRMTSSATDARAPRRSQVHVGCCFAAPRLRPVSRNPTLTPPPLQLGLGELRLATVALHIDALPLFPTAAPEHAFELANSEAVSTRIHPAAQPRTHGENYCIGFWRSPGPHGLQRLLL